MASLILGAAGAFVGFSVGGPQGAQLGFAIGSAAGGALTPGPHTEGARLSDLKVQVSSYGFMLPFLWGTNRITGNIIWSTDLQETSHDTEQGKGNGGATVTNFTYSVSFWVALCNTGGKPILGIRRIWGNNTLMLDARPSNTGVTGQSGNIRVYTGSMDQMPSALMESYLGVGNVPGYRGTAGCEFENLQLEPYGNRPPNLSFEVVASGSKAIPAVIDYDTGYSNAKFGVTGIGNHIWGYQTGGYPNDPNILICVDSITGATILVNEMLPLSTYDVYEGVAFVPTLNEVWITTNALSRDVHIHDAITGARKETFTIPGANTYWIDIMYVPATDSVAIFSDQTYNIVYDAGTRLSIGGVNGQYGNAPRIYTSSNNYIYIASANYSSASYQGLSIHDIKTGDFIQGLADFNTYYTGICFDTRRGKVVLWNQDILQLVIIDEATLAVSYNTITDGFTASALLYLEEVDKYFGLNPSYYFILDPDTLAVEHKIGHSASEITMSDVPIISCAISGNNGHVYKFPYTERITADEIFYADVITDICGMVNLQPSDIDVSTISDSGIGYAISQQMTARSAIETLQPIIFFDAVESD